MFFSPHHSVVLRTQTQWVKVRRKSRHSFSEHLSPWCVYWVELRGVGYTDEAFASGPLRHCLVPGISGKLTSRGVCVCISTAFEGNLLDSYFVDLVMEKPLWIHHHSVPVFIPLEEISAKYLQTNTQHFLFVLWEYLNAYSGRKYQADRLQVSDLTKHFVSPDRLKRKGHVLLYFRLVHNSKPEVWLLSS